jgi:hypothetical protein
MKQYKGIQLRPGASSVSVPLLVALALLAGCARAGSLAHVDLFDRELGQVLETHRAKGRDYVVGEPGHEYAIRVRNRSPQRLLAVISVDGINVVTGETASPDQAGYVIEPGDYVNILGWRKDLDRTAAFYFTDLDDSYAARTGRPGHLGVIGVALFRERPRLALLGQTQPDARQESPAAAAPAHRDAGNSPERAAETRLGTGHGRGEHSPVRRVEFERSSRRPEETLVFRYDRESRLIAMGVLPAPRTRWPEPEPFPAALGFVPDP